ncbi:MAG TPA: glycosyltransferase family 2 protein [Acidobacteriota bacterium]|nr:glycosyltransferase family 2 protein [Acidobacteriota bacterium]
MNPQPEILNQITVVVLNWNGLAHLPCCLSSLRRQKFQRFKTMLVDNGSTDRSVDFVRREFPEVYPLALDVNLGFAAANNRAIEQCDTPWIALLNNDTEADPSWLEALMEAAAQHTETSFFASQIRLFDQRDRLDSAGDGLPIAGAAFKIGHHQPATCYGEVKPAFGASAAAALYRTSMLRDLGGFDEDFFYIYEDADLNLRAQLAGYRCMYVPKAVVYHKVNTTLRQAPKQAVFYGQRNSEWLLWKNMPSSLLWKYLPLRVLYFFLSFFYFAMKGHAATFLRAKWAAWKGRQKILEKRRNVQRQTKVSVAYLESLLERRWLRTRLAGKI